MMYTIFSKDTGRIIKTIGCPEDLLSVQFDALTEDSMVGAFGNDEFYILNGVPCSIPAQPSRHHIFDFTTKQWQDPRTLQDLKDAQWVIIKKSRDAEIASPLVTPYGTFDADGNSRTAITDSVLLLQTLSKRGQPRTIGFTLADNTDIDLSMSQMEDVGLMLGEKTNLAFAKGRLLRVLLEAATTQAEVNAVVW